MSHNTEQIYQIIRSLSTFSHNLNEIIDNISHVGITPSNGKRLSRMSIELSEFTDKLINEPYPMSKHNDIFDNLMNRTI